MTKPAKQSTPQLRFLKNGELPTQEEISAWKEKHGDVFLLQEELESDLLSGAEDLDIMPEDDPGEVLLYVRKPTRRILKFVTDKVNKEKADAIRFTELMLRNVWLAGHKEILEDDGLLMGIGVKLEELMGIKSVELKKL